MNQELELRTLNTNLEPGTGTMELYSYSTPRCSCRSSSVKRRSSDATGRSSDTPIATAKETIGDIRGFQTFIEAVLPDLPLALNSAHGTA